MNPQNVTSSIERLKESCESRSGAEFVTVEKEAVENLLSHVDFCERLLTASLLDAKSTTEETIEDLFEF